MPSKLEKFRDVESFANCMAFDFRNLQEGFALKGKWREEHFKHASKNTPVVLELGCGKGEYTVGLAGSHPEKCFIGVDIKGNRIWTGAGEALQRNMQNVAFLRTRIDFIDHCFAENEVDEVWITFPDPQPQKTRARKRLTHPLFINRYKKFLRKDGVIHLKTDSTSLYEYTLGMIKDEKHELIWHSPDLEHDCPAERQELLTIRTYYEKLFSAKGEKIKYILFRLNS